MVGRLQALHCERTKQLRYTSLTLVERLGYIQCAPAGAVLANGTPGGPQKRFLMGNQKADDRADAP